MTGGRSRRELWAQTQRVIEALAKPATVPELVTRTGIERRTLYRILRNLPEGITVEVVETPRQGRGRARRQYQVTQDVTDQQRVAVSPVLQDALRRAALALKEAQGFARSIGPTAEEISRTLDIRTIRGAASRISAGAARVLAALARGDTALAKVEIEARRLAKTK